MEKVVSGIFVLLYMLVASVHGGDWLNGDQHIMVPQQWNPQPLLSNLDPPQDEGDAFISPEISSRFLSSSKVDNNCTEDGLFSFADSCKDFYYCVDLSGKGLEWSIIWLKCPEGEVFDDNSKECRPSSLVTWHPECQEEEEEFTAAVTNDDNEVLPSVVSSSPSDVSVGISGEVQIQNRRKRSLGSFEVSGEKVIDILAQSARETCTDVRNIDKYINQINSKSPITIPSFDEEVYSNILKEYNMVLAQSKSNVIVWRGRNSILDALKETYKLTKEFEPKFQHRFGLIKENVKIVMIKESLDVERMEEERMVLLEEVRQTKDTLNKTKGANVFAYIIEYIQTSIKNKQIEINRLTKEIKEAKADVEFQELVKLLEYVQNNAIEIQEHAENTRHKLENFKDVIVKDSTAFKRNHEKAGEGIRRIQAIKEENRRETARKNTEMINLRVRIQNEINDAERTNRRLEESKASLEWQRRRLEQLERESRKKMDDTKYYSWIPVAGQIAAVVVLTENIKKVKRLYSEKRNVVNSYYSHLEVQNALINRLNNEVNSLNSRIRDLSRRTERLSDELVYFEGLDDDLEDLQDDVDSILPFLSKAITSVQKMKQVFHDAEGELEDVILLAKTGKTNAQRRVYSYFMYHETDKLKSHWNNARDKIISLGQCV